MSLSRFWGPGLKKKFSTGVPPKKAKNRVFFAIKLIKNLITEKGGYNCLYRRGLGSPTIIRRKNRNNFVQTASFPGKTTPKTVHLHPTPAWPGSQQQWLYRPIYDLLYLGPPTSDRHED